MKVALKIGKAKGRQCFTELVGKTTCHVMGTSSCKGSTSSSSRSYSERADDVIRQFAWVTRSPDKDGAIVVKQAENGLDKSHAGEVFSVPLVDCAKTPTRGYLGLGTPEQERAKRRDYQQRLDKAAARRNMTVETWCPAWAGTSHREKSPIDDEWSAFDARC